MLSAIRYTLYAILITYTLYPLSVYGLPGTEFGAQDDLTVFGTDGNVPDPDVEIKGFSIFGSTNVATHISTAAGNTIFNGAIEVSSDIYVVGKSTFTDNIYLPAASGIFVQDGIPGQLLLKNAGGYLYWDSIGAVGDNLGSHIATTTLNMAGFGITNASTSTFNGYVNVTSTAGYAQNGYIILRASDTSNTFVGREAGRINTGEYNSFVGYQAGYSNTTGGYNAFIGHWAGQSNITGGYNAFVGSNAGRLNTSSYNSFLGAGAGELNSTGQQNSFVGYAAGYSNTTGNLNSFLGYQAGNQTQTGSGNAILGSEAGYGGGGSFSSSTLVGYRAGYSLTTGNNNILLGSKAGDSITSGASNIIIGYDQDAPAATTSNFLNIGGVLYGDLSVKTIGISRNVPQAALDVVSTGTAANQMAQIWRDSAGVIVGSMSATGMMTAVKFIGDVSGASGLPAGDNLGSHIATTTLDMAGFDIVNVDTITAQGQGIYLGTHVFVTQGNVGIGTTAPAAELHVSSANAVASSMPFLVSSGAATGQELFVVKGDGKVGIGTTGPLGHLHVYQNWTGNNLNVFFENAVSGQSTLVRAKANDNYAGFMSDGLSQDWVIGQWDGSTNFLIQDRTAPYSTPFVIEPDAGDNVLYLKAGNVGIGTANPQSRLDVTGIIRSTGPIAPGDGTNFQSSRYMYDDSANYRTAFSSNVYIVGYSSAAKYYGDGASLTGISGDNLGNHTATTDLSMGANNITMTGSLGATGARLTKGWFTDLEVTNAIVGNISGSAGSTTGNVATASALAADPSDCTLPNVALGINASGTAQCSQPSNVTGSAATAGTAG
ncbi:MAG: hypothetical protein ABIG11_06085, partial [bacterium]